jgi:hypothetical protein
MRRAAKNGGVATATGVEPSNARHAEAANRDKRGARHCGLCYVIGKRRRRTRVRSTTMMLRVISLSAMTSKNLLHPRGHIGRAPVTATKQDQAWSFRSGESQQPRMI